MIKRVLILAFPLLLSLVLKAQVEYKSGWGVPATFGNPFLSDMNSTISTMEVGVNSNRPGYDIVGGVESYKWTVNTNLGATFPFWTGNFSENKFGLSFSLPVHFRAWVDMFEKTTAPVLNTDYSFAPAQIKFIHRMNKRILKSYSLKFVPFYHQSSHIGDELTIYRRDIGLPLTRVNVSYNYAELSLWINEAEQKVGKRHSFRIGFMYLLNPDKGWYSIHPSEGDTTLAVSINSPYEIYFQYQLQTGKYFLSGEKLQNVFSLELRDRLKYGYPTFSDFDTNIKEYRVANINIYWGWRLNQPILISNHLGFGFRVYYGINPHGQFRNNKDYFYSGFSIVLE